MLSSVLNQLAPRRTSAAAWPPVTRRAWMRFGFAVGVISGAFGLPLIELAFAAWKSDLVSYVLLIPFATIFLAWQRTPELATRHASAHRVGGLLCGGAALALVLALTTGVISRSELAPLDRLAGYALAYVFAVWAAGFWFLGSRVMRVLAGPALFMLFLVPPPGAMVEAVEIGLQHGSAETVNLMFLAWGTTFLRDGLEFGLAAEHGMLRLAVAPECSGIHSTIVLFVVASASGLLLLNSRGHRAWLIAAVIPIALLRNGLRIFLLGELSVRYGTHVLDSWFHKSGGNLMFAFSLVPLFALLLLLRWREISRARRQAVVAPTPSSQAT